MNKNKNIIKNSIKVMGISLTILSIYFLTLSFYKNYQTIIDSVKQTTFPYIFIIGLILYSLTQIIMVTSWYIQLKSSYPKINFKQIYRIIGISQIGKYLPGNIAHIGSRFYLAKIYGLKARDITTSFIYESTLVIASALMVGSLYLLYFNFPMVEININSYRFYILGILGLLFITGLTVTIQSNKLLTIKKIVCIIFLFIISHYLLGIIIYLEQIFLLHESTSIFILTSMLSLSFIVGYLTPGAPGGIGVREFVFLKLAALEIEENNALVLIITLRLITIVGDLLMYFYSLKIKKANLSININ